MLINPNGTLPDTVPGTRILVDALGLSGFQCGDISTYGRTWILQYLCAPIKQRRLGGIRARFIDNKGYVSFCNQRDLEVMVGLGQPGAPCRWADSDYAEPGSPDWFGMCVDDEDLEDDLLDRELRLREQYPEVLPTHLEMTRRIHNGSSGYEELLLLIGDIDPVSGVYPDCRFETLTRRWARVEKTPLHWEVATV